MRNRTYLTVNCTGILFLVFTTLASAGPVGNVRGISKLQKETDEMGKQILAGMGNSFLMLEAFESSKPAEDFRKKARGAFDTAHNRCQQVVVILNEDKATSDTAWKNFKVGIKRVEVNLEALVKTGTLSRFHIEVTKEMQKVDTSPSIFHPLCNATKTSVTELDGFTKKVPPLRDQWRFLGFINQILARGQLISLIFEEQ